MELRFSAGAWRGLRAPLLVLSCVGYPPALEKTRQGMARAVQTCERKLGKSEGIFFVAVMSVFKLRDPQARRRMGAI